VVTVPFKVTKQLKDRGKKERASLPSLVNLMKGDPTAWGGEGSRQASGLRGNSFNALWITRESGYICGGSRGLVCSSNSARVIVWSSAERFIYSTDQARGERRCRC
jgi:hypothetical protein